MKQAQVSSNLDYLIQVGWVREVVKERSFKTGKGMELSREQFKYKISDVGINHLEAGTMFKRSHTANHINITNVRGVTVVGDGNIVNTEFTDLARCLEELDLAIAGSQDLSDEQKLEAAADLSTIRSRIAKKSPSREIIGVAWKTLARLADIATLAPIIAKVGTLLAGFNL